jgi:hypothetical protein
MKSSKRIELIIAVVVLLTVSSLDAAAQTTQSSGPRATKVRIEMQEIYGPLFVTIAGAEKKITDQAQQAWIINGGRHVVYSSSDGAGGFENEGQSLHLYDVHTGKRQRIMSEYYVVENVEEIVTSKRKRALLVEMADGGLGASYIAVVDPARGEVFFRGSARITAHQGDSLVLGFYKEDDWEELAQGKKVRPYKSQRYNLNSLLLRRVIVNKRDLGSL